MRSTTIKVRDNNRVRPIIDNPNNPANLLDALGAGVYPTGVKRTVEKREI